MGLDGLTDHGVGGAVATSGLIGPGPDEGELETANRGEMRIGGRRLEELSDQLGTPGGMFPFEAAGDVQRFLDGRGDRSATGLIVGHQAIGTIAAEEAADPPDGAEGDGQLDGDLSQGLALLMTPNDLLAERDREWARHGGRLQGPEEDHLLRRLHVIHADECCPNFPALRGGLTLLRVTGKPDLLPYSRGGLFS